MRIAEGYNTCYGCSPTNEHGMQLNFVQVGERTVECRWTAPEHVCGAPGVMHGGVQAALLDETLGYAVRTAIGYGHEIVTAELSIAYRRPVPVGEPIVARAWVEREDLPDLHLAAQIHVSNGDHEKVLTRATARWKALRRRVR